VPFSGEGSAQTLSIDALVRRLLAAAVVVPCSCTTFAAVPLVDSQLWSELDATHPITADLSATGIFTTRLGNDLPNPTLTAGGLQLDYRIGAWTASVTGYYASTRNAQSGGHTGIWLPAAALTYEIGFGPMALSDRNRVEQLEGLPNSPMRYRNRAGADWHFPGEHALSDLFVADEVFYDFSRDRWTRNRAQVGVEFYLTASARLQTFYMRQNNTYGAPDRLNVLGLTVQIDIK
jgi:hypothetical protein